MKIHHTDQDQINMLKEWWHNYGRALTIAIVAGLLLGYGWRFWHSHRQKTLQQASIQYQSLLSVLQSNPPDRLQSVQRITQNLKQEYPKTPYASLASLFLAKSNVDQKNYASAINDLTWVLQHSSDSTLKQLARLRIARIKLSENKADQALSILNTVEDPTYSPYIDLIKGSIYQEKGDHTKTQSYFESTTNQLQAGAITYDLLPLLKSTPLPRSTT